MTNFKKMSKGTLPLFGLFSLTIAFAFFSCNKEKLPNENLNITQQSLSENSEEDNEIVTNEYVYQGISYFLQYDESDETGQPLPSDDRDALETALGSQEYYSVRHLDSLRRIFLYDSEEEDSTDFFGFNYENLEDLEEVDFVMNRAPLMDYFEHDNFAGEHLNGDAVSGLACRGSNCCSKLIHRSDLRTVPRANGGNWNDVISSLKVNATSLTDSAHDKVFLILYRDAGFPRKKCKREIFDLNPRITSDNQQNSPRTLNISRLRSLRWCWGGGRMNDDINGWILLSCKSECDNCWRVR